MRVTHLATALTLAALAACSTPSGDAASPLAGTTWRLAELQSNDDAIGIVRPDDPAKYELTLAADGAVSARLDCNRGVGHWESPQAGQIAFGQMAMTRAMCLEGSLDTRVARELNYVRTYMIEGDRLRLIMMADGGSQVWTRAGR